MHFPPLRSLGCLTNPAGPRWNDVALSTPELEALLRRMVMVVGWDDIVGEPRVLGSGFLVGIEPNLIAITAAHVLTDWANHVRPRRPHAFSGLQGDEEDLRKRVNDLVQRNRIHAVLHGGTPGMYCMCEVDSLTLTADSRTIDVACMKLRGAREAGVADFDAFSIDVEPGRWQGQVLMAGFVKGSWWEPPKHGEKLFRLQQTFVLRAGYCRGLVAEPPGFRNPMYQLNMPAEAGMSGGPVLALRHSRSASPRIVTAKPDLIPTAIGIVSRDCIAPTVLLDGSDPGETWVAPIEDAYFLKLGWRDRSMRFDDVVRDGRIRSYGTRALTATITEDEAEQKATLSFETADAPRLDAS
jgi:hypothetical protein